MSGQVSRGSAGEYQADERAGVARVSWRVSADECPTLSNPIDCSLPGPSIHGVFQARVLEWASIAFSDHRNYPSVNLVTHSLAVQWSGLWN